MIKNYFKIALRNLIGQKFYSIINIMGLSIGITVCILITLYIRQDFSYDKYHRNADMIYRVTYSHTRSNGETKSEAESTALLGPALKEEYPGIKQFARIYFSRDNLVKAGNEKYFEDKVAFADSAFFDIFSYKILSGDKDNLLKKNNSMVLTESAAKKYFGKEDPLGREIELDNKYRFEITGVIEDVPVNSHFKFDFIASYSSLSRQDEAIYLNQWGATFGSYTYILVDPGFNPVNFEKKTEDFFKRHTNFTFGERWRVLVQPLLDIHLKSHRSDEIEENSSIARINIIGSIGIFILLLACINFINLSTARSSKRAREIGIRKIFGAYKIQLIKQFIGESVLLSIISLGISLVTVAELLPLFSRLTGMQIKFNFQNEIITLLIISGGVLLIGVLAGIYPAFVLSSYKPIKVLKSDKLYNSGNRSAAFLRKGLVIFQFAISIILIAGTVIINYQLKYVRDFNMGFDKEYMVVIPAFEDVKEKYPVIKNELRIIPNVKNVTACCGAPISTNTIGTECRPKGLENPESFRINVNSIDGDYLDHFGIKVIAGRNFPGDSPGTLTNVMLINEKMVKSLGYTNPQDAIGKPYFISLNGYKPEIIGVVKDYNFSSLHDEVSPQVFMHIPRFFSEFVVKINSSDIPSTINRLKNVWAVFFPQYPFKYHFLDESIDEMYKTEAKYSEVISVMSAIAVFIACLGLLGLTSYIAEQRKKEIGIRKVLGASVKDILQNVVSEFVALVIISNIIAYPVAYYFMNKWLQDFVYRIEISWWILVLSGGIVLLIALLTMSYQSIKAAVVNPIASLRSE
jgi:putative ABC transport system permease protein